MSNLVSLHIDNYQFRTKSIVQYYTYALPTRVKENIAYFLKDEANRLRIKTYSGEMTVGSKKRLTRAVSLLVQSSQERQVLNPVTNRMMSFKLNFVTLTMPISEKSKDAKFCNKSLLEPFLRTLRRKYSVKSYIWKCELTKQNNVHYHLTTDTFINHTNLRNEWNRVLDREGMLEGFKAKYGHNNPNSTDIHKVYKVKNFENYLIKYVTKPNANGVALNAKVWDCSRNLKNAKYFVIEGSARLYMELERLEQQKVLTRYSSDNFSIFKFENFDIRRLLTPKQFKAYFYHLKCIRDDKELYYQSPESRPGWDSDDFRSYLPGMGVSSLPTTTIQKPSDQVSERQKESSRVPELFDGCRDSA